MNKTKSRNKTTLLSVALIIVSLIIIVATTLAYFTDRLSTKDTMQFGKISIVEGKGFKSGSASLKDKLPGDKITDTISFSKAVDSQPMYVRAKVSFTTNGNDAVKAYVQELNNGTFAIKEYADTNYKWSDRIGNYYYLMDMAVDTVHTLNTTEEIILADSLVLSIELTQDEEKSQYMQEISLSIEIQAIQTAGITNDFDTVNIKFGEVFGEKAVKPLTETDKKYFTFDNGAVTGLTEEGKQLSSIVVPSTDNDNNPVTSIGDYAFWGCSGLTSVKYTKEVEGSYSYKNGKLTIFDGAMVDSPQWSKDNINPLILEVVFNGTETSIGNYAFSGCSALTSITIPSSVTSIGDRAFYNCSGLTNVTYTKEVEGKYKFENGTLTIYDDGMTDKPQWYVDNINPLILNVVFNGNETSIAQSAFQDCSGLTSIDIPSGVTSIGDSAFGNCSGLTSITIPDSVTSISKCTFADCSSLTSVTFEDPNGWFVADSSTETSETDVLLNDTAQNATYLKNTYLYKYWIKKSA